MKAPRPGRFASDRPHDLHARPAPWHRLAHVTRTLPPRLRELCAALDAPAGACVVDYGCAESPYRESFHEGVTYLAADLPGNPAADLELSPAGVLPLEAGSVEVVLSTQVLEHVEDPVAYLAECARVLRPDGRLLLSTHGMMLYHPDPVDYWRWTGAGLEKIVTDAGFEVLEREGVIGLAATGLQFFQDAVHGFLPRGLRDVWAFVMQGLVALADRLEPQSVRRHNALVFVVTARRR